jgi:ribosomal protein L11 methyltransferase
VAFERWGLRCAPRAAPEQARRALAACPFPIAPLPAPPGWPDPPAALVAGWYRRSPGHAPAPSGLPELVQAPGPGFGPGDHATTAMCLAALPLLPDGAALDVGCGSGLLAQAWARLARGPVRALDADAGAVDQAARSLRAAGLADRVELWRGPLERLTPAELADRVILANLPAPAQAALVGRIGSPPRAAPRAGVRPGAAAPLVARYRALGLRPAAAARRGRWECWALVAG